MEQVTSSGGRISSQRTAQSKSTSRVSVSSTGSLPSILIPSPGDIPTDPNNRPWTHLNAGFSRPYERASHISASFNKGKPLHRSFSKFQSSNEEKSSTLDSSLSLSPKKPSNSYSSIDLTRDAEELTMKTSRYLGSKTERQHSSFNDAVAHAQQTERSVPIVQWRKISSIPETERLEDSNDVTDDTHNDLGKCLTCAEGDKILKLLPCLHTFCESCLEMRIQDHPSHSWFKCELCQRQINLPTNGVNGFEDNVFSKFSDQSVTENDRCDVCKGSIPSCKCAECKIYLCSDCVKGHLTTDTEHEHYIVNVRQEMVGHSPKEIICGEHSPFTLELFCVTCAKPICGRCAIGRHATHICENIQVTSIDRRNELKQMTQDSGTRRVFREIRDNIKACHREKSVIEEDSQNTVRAIQAHIQNLKEELDAYGQKLIKEVLENESKAIATLGKKIDDGERNEKALKVSMATLKQISERLRDVDIINKYDSLKATITEAKRSSKSLPVQSVRIKYKPLIQSIKPLMGRIQTKTSLKKPLDYIEICSLNFQKFVSAICPIDENKAWVGYRKFIQLCAKDGSQGTRVDMEETVVSIATTSSDAIVVCCKASVKALLNKPAHKVLFHLVHEPSDMVVNENDNPIVCFKEAKKVTVFSIRGKPLQEMDVRNLGFRFGFRMNDPWKLALDDNQNVYLTDYLSETIVVYDRYFELKTAFASNVYRNASLCCSRGLLFVADYKRDCVQILSESGDLLQTCQTSAIGSPSSIAVDKTGSLWLGSLSGQVKVYSKR